MILPFPNSGRIPYNSEIDSLVMNEVLRKSDENDRYIFGLIIAIMDRGQNWANSITYEKYDTIKFNGSYYMSLVDDNINIEPTNANKWWKITENMQLKTPINKPTINSSSTNIDVNDTITLTISTFDPRTSEFIWNVTGATYDVIEGAVNGSTDKTLKLKIKSAGTVTVKVMAKTTNTDMADSDWSNIIYIRSSNQSQPGITIRDTSLYGTQNYGGVRYFEGSYTSYLSYDVKQERGETLKMYITFGDNKNAEVTFPRSYLNNEIIVTYAGKDYTGTFKADTSEGDRQTLAERGANVQPKQRPADGFRVPDNYTAKIDHLGYESGVSYTEPVTNSTWFLFNKKSWDNSVPAEIMFFKAGDIIGKLDFAGEYLNERFRVETKDGTKAWEGSFEKAEEYIAPVVLTKVLG